VLTYPASTGKKRKRVGTKIALSLTGLVEGVTYRTLACLEDKTDRYTGSEGLIWLLCPTKSRLHRSEYGGRRAGSCDRLWGRRIGTEQRCEDGSIQLGTGTSERSLPWVWITGLRILFLPITDDVFSSSFSLCRGIVRSAY